MIIVATTPGRDYLLDTIAGIDSSAKSNNKVILCDGKELLTDIPAGWKSIYFTKPQICPHINWAANKYSMWEAFKLAVEEDEDLIFFEDDIIFSKGAVDLIENFTVPQDVAWVTFFSPFGTKSMPTYLIRLPCKTYLFSQAIKFSNETCKILHNQYDKMYHHFRHGGSDELLAIIGDELCLKYGIFFPSIVQHIGEKSIVGNGKLTDLRTSQSFRGTEFNAKCLDLTNYV